MDHQQKSIQLSCSSKYQLHYHQCNPLSLIMLKNAAQMEYLDSQRSFMDDGTGQLVHKYFPNYFILTNLKVAHQQKRILHAMLNQPSCPFAMIRQFCKLARRYYRDQIDNIDEFQKYFIENQEVKDSAILQWYSRQTFFYHLLNQLLRAGKDSTQLFYAQYYVQLLRNSIKSVYEKQKKQDHKQISGSFIVYRGAYFKLQGSVGKHIETLGFFSTTLKKQVAERFISNSLIEIEVSNVPKDDKVDFGYAYLNSSQYTINQDQNEVLFNVLSSFQIKSINLLKNIWHIKLEYGVTYQMKKMYDQNKLVRGSAEQEQILAIIQYQDLLKYFSLQENCLFEQEGLIDQCIQMSKIRIQLLKNTPKFEKQAELFQYQLYVYMNRSTKQRKKDSLLIRQIQTKPKKQNQDQKTNQQISIKLIKMILMTFLQIFQDRNINSYQVKQSIQRYKQLKQQIELRNFGCQCPNCTHSAKLKELLKQMQTTIKLSQIKANITIYQEKNDMVKLNQELEIAEKTKYEFLQTKGINHPAYRHLQILCFHIRLSLGQITYQTYLQRLQQDLIRPIGVVDESRQFGKQLLKTWKQANRFILEGQWTEAVKVCAQLRNKQEPFEQFKDIMCFQPIAAYLNQKTTTFTQKLEILEAFLSISHPQSAQYYKNAKELYTLCKSKQNQHRLSFIQQTKRSLEKEPNSLLAQLTHSQQKIITNFSKNSLVQIVNQCLLVNTLRMMGKYEQANKHIYKLKQQIKTSKLPEYCDYLDYCLLEERQVDQTTQNSIKS